MAKLIKEFSGVPNGSIYPVSYKTGDNVPDELISAARQLGAIEDDSKEKTKTVKSAETKMLKGAPENKMLKGKIENKAK